MHRRSWAGFQAGSEHQLLAGQNKNLLRVLLPIGKSSEVTKKTMFKNLVYEGLATSLQRIMNTRISILHVSKA
uniref:Uncharacterized protein n=1 Tax=Setaria viridis TaxID=4556 RepID=A0A4U6VEP7_SETVI|nr:hypothetical protein SEVIR_3G293200v2 [Setaria viridis]